MRFWISCGNTTVSYTHLDVYKRQDQKCNGIDEAGLFSAPSKKVHAAGENILKDRQHGGQRGKGHKDKEAVSYTHLDVYKRQNLLMSGIHTQNNHKD